MRVLQDCANVEETSPNLILTQLHLDVDSRYDQYQTCNICVKGRDPMAAFGVDRDRTCSMTPIPEYVCACDRGKVCDDTRVGKELVGPFFKRLRVREPPHSQQQHIPLLHLATCVFGVFMPTHRNAIDRAATATKPFCGLVALQRCPEIGGRDVVQHSLGRTVRWQRRYGAM